MVSFMVLFFGGWSIYHENDGYHPGCKSGNNTWQLGSRNARVYGYEVVSYPAVCAGGLILILFGSENIDTFPIFFLFGLLFIGLSYENTWSTGKSFWFFTLCDDVFSGLLTNWFMISSSIQFRDHGSYWVLFMFYILAYRCRYIGVANRNYH
jgi:hypothetical protein